MIRYIATTSLLVFGLIESAQALPWFQTGSDLTKPSASQTQVIHENRTNFSGTWVGQCNNSPAVELVIKHNNNNLNISYGFMSEKYIIGEVKSDARTDLNALEHSNVMVRWSNDNRALIFINSAMFINASEHSNVFFSKVSMVLVEENLIVTGSYYQTDGTLGDFNKETMSCSYHKI
ncbi:hypothetical protein [uncultured Legionella sp.]|uniref:hypothetical protein n=1 Tax=uncultured Legionella sp. TaxID=210934 RepID=UPI002637A612|nr:hypothetical protein [uncultured Legionella sp.]